MAPPDADDRAGGDALRDDIRRRSRAVTFVSAGIVVLALTLGIPLFERDPDRSALERATRDPLWAAVVASLLLIPSLFVWWRRSSFRVLRPLAVVLCLVVAISSCAATVRDCGGNMHTYNPDCFGLMLSAMLLFSGFIAAPRPGPPPGREDLRTRSSLRRHDRT
jgi:hypothetical protein